VKYKKILVTGGHFSPSLALADELINQNIDVVFVGRKSAFKEQADSSLEYRVMSAKNNIKFYTLNTGRLIRQFSLSAVLELFKVVISIISSVRIITVEKPDLIFSFGGYVSVPVCTAARIFKIPIYLHEQTIYPGIANRLIAKFANKIFVTFPESKKLFPKNNTKIVGIPIRKNILQKDIKPTWYVNSNKPLILVLGGSSGSHSINKIISKNIVKLTTKYHVIHQTGDNKFNDFSTAQKEKISNYMPVRFIFPGEIAYLLNKASVVISRSGANTFFELIYFKKPSILIPLPWSAENEQLLQARILENHKVAKIFDQSRNAYELPLLVDEIYKNRNQITKRFSNLQMYEKLIQQPREFVEKTFA
jgi:UDP-N-acetylglucosamine--N-acetylmuramyl-(pentapeptide) pyrophosphoryl-undecaprenol N-acetylglucosamine transferase